MIAGCQLDEWSLLATLEARHSFHGPRVRLVKRDAVAKPPKERPNVRGIEVVQVASKGFALLRYPDPKPEVFRCVDYRYLDHAANVEGFVVDSTNVGVALCSGCSFGLRDTEVRIWPAESEIRQVIVGLSTCFTTVRHVSVASTP